MRTKIFIIIFFVNLMFVACGDNGSVEIIRPDASSLNADNQIAILENKMEEMAGAG